MVGNSTSPWTEQYFYDNSSTTQAQEPLWSPICYIIVICVGLFGNLMSMALLLILKEVRKTSMHLFVFNLAVSDLLFLVTIVFTTSQILNGKWLYSDFLCKLSVYVGQLCHASACLLLSAMSIGRFVDTLGGSSTGKVEAVRRFFRNYTYQVILVVIFWIVSASYASYFGANAFKDGIEPNCKCGLVFAVERDCNEYDEGIERIECDSLPPIQPSCINYTEEYAEDYVREYSEDYPEGAAYEPNPDYDKEVHDYVLNFTPELELGCHYLNVPQWHTWLYVRFIFTFIIPSLIMIVFNYSIARNLLKTNVMRIDEENEGKQQRRLEAIKCLALVICFILCWLPNHAVHMLKIKGIKMSSNFCANITSFASLIAHLHSALNPFIYMTIGNDFLPRIRKAKKVLMGFCVTKRTEPTDEPKCDIVQFNSDASAEEGYSIRLAMMETAIAKNTEEKN